MKAIELNLTGTVSGHARTISERCLAVAAMFGIGIEQGGPRTLFENVLVSIEGGDVILITGPSGAGKSTLLRAMAEKLRDQPAITIMQLDDIPLPADRAVVDCFPGTLQSALSCLARSGLSEARLLLQSPAELSEGQRFRYRLAQFFASETDILIADEFAAMLDRVTARVVAHQLGKFVRGNVATSRPRTAIIATTHEDLTADLAPSQTIYVGFHGGIKIQHTGRMP